MTKIEMLLIIAVGIIIIQSVALILFYNRLNSLSRLAWLRQNNFIEMIKQAEQSISVKRFENEPRLYSAYERLMARFRGLLSSYYENENNSKRFVSEFRKMVEMSSPDAEFWQDMKVYVNAANGDIIDWLRCEYNTLTNKEINFIMLTICDFSYIEIAICMGYTNVKSISNRRVLIAKKLGTDLPLKDYLTSRIASLKGSNEMSV